MTRNPDLVFSKPESELKKMTGVRWVHAGDAEEEGQDYQAQTEEPQWAKPHSSSVGRQRSQRHGAIGLILVPDQASPALQAARRKFSSF